MIEILSRRSPGVHIRLFPALVQGAGSADGVVAGIEYFARSGWPQVIIVGRGGGSLEDLWTFNEEPVARAIAACPIPIVSAVGHETDFTIADFVADLRAPTPSAAAELVVPERRKLLEQVEGYHLGSSKQRGLRLMKAGEANCTRKESIGVWGYCVATSRAVGNAWTNSNSGSGNLPGGDYSQVAGCWKRGRRGCCSRTCVSVFRWCGGGLSGRRRRPANASQAKLRTEQGRVDQLSAQLHQLSPLRVLERGYAMVQAADGKLIREAAEAPENSTLEVRLWKGRLRAVVTESASPEE